MLFLQIIRVLFREARILFFLMERLDMHNVSQIKKYDSKDRTKEMSDETHITRKTDSNIDKEKNTYRLVLYISPGSKIHE